MQRTTARKESPGAGPPTVEFKAKCIERTFPQDNIGAGAGRAILALRVTSFARRVTYGVNLERNFVSYDLIPRQESSR